MLDRERVIKGLENCVDIFKKCEDGCPYYNKIELPECNQLKKDALALLKEQEPVEPESEHHLFVCPVCRSVLRREQKFCHECGKPMAWGGWIE